MAHKGWVLLPGGEACLTWASGGNLVRSSTSVLLQRQPRKKRKITATSKSACYDFPQFLTGILRSRHASPIEDYATVSVITLTAA